MIGHLGSRVSALLDGQLSREEEERAWQHVHTCHQCRDQVEREGWVKTRLAHLSQHATHLPTGLLGALRDASDDSFGLPPGEVLVALAQRPESRLRRTGRVAALGGGAAGVAVMGLLALGAAPADAPTFQRPGPVTQVGNPAPGDLVGPARRAGRP